MAEEAVCADCERRTTVCTCGHDPDSCPALFVDDQGWLLRCQYRPGHPEDYHESGDWAWVADEYGMPPVAEPAEPWADD